MFLYVCTSARPSWLMSDCLSTLCSNILHANQPQKMNATNLTTYPGLFKYLLKCNEKVERYRHHVVFNTTYLELNVIPKGFCLKSHSHIEDCDRTSLLRKCSKKLMVKRKPRVRNYKSHIVNAHKTCCIVRHFLEHWMKRIQQGI